MAKSLAERLSAHEQEKARLAEKEAKLKADGRKARNTKIYQAGGLVEKAGLLELEPNALYGALLSLKEGASGKDQVTQWAALGGRAFAREARLRDEGKEPIVLTFPAAQRGHGQAARRRIPLQQGVPALGRYGHARRGRSLGR
jgi:hypothetical protein